MSVRFMPSAERQPASGNAAHYGEAPAAIQWVQTFRAECASGRLVQSVGCTCQLINCNWKGRLEIV